jgi:hypothetical protein
MSNQATRLGDCPAERLAQCRGWAGPPVGEKVEVLACASFAKSGNIQCWSLQRDHASLRKLEGEGQTVIELVDRTHVTRLQAEVSALQQRLNIADQLANDLQVELAKSRRSSRFGQIG